MINTGVNIFFYSSYLTHFHFIIFIVVYMFLLKNADYENVRLSEDETIISN